MNWYKKPQDLYDLLLLEDLFHGNTGNYVTRVPGGWIFYVQNMVSTKIGTFVPFNDEFKFLNDENNKSLADQNLSEKKDSETG